MFFNPWSSTLSHDSKVSSNFCDFWHCWIHARCNQLNFLNFQNVNNYQLTFKYKKQIFPFSNSSNQSFRSFIRSKHNRFFKNQNQNKLLPLWYKCFKIPSHFQCPWFLKQTKPKNIAFAKMDWRRFFILLKKMKNFYLTDFRLWVIKPHAEIT